MSQNRRRQVAPTIRDVAAAAGVSPSTVSRAFTRPDLLSAPTVARITQISAQMGYAPDQTARSLSTGRKDTVALLVPDIANPFFPPLIKGVERHFQERGVSVLLAETDEEPTREAQLAATIRSRVDGVIIASPRSDADELRALTGRLPLVLVNRDVPGVRRVLIDTAIGMRQAVEHLHQLGHRSLVYLAGPEQSWSNAQRRAAFEDTCRQLGIHRRAVPSRRPDYDSGVEAAPGVLASGATGVIAFDDSLAQGLVFGLATRGVSVPGGMSVIGCDDLAAATSVPPLTSISASIGSAGVMAAGQLEAQMARGPRRRPDSGEPAEIITAVLRVRESTAAPRVPAAI